MTAAATNAVVASWMVAVPGSAVGAVGAPVNAGESSAALAARSAVRPEMADCGNAALGTTGAELNVLIPAHVSLPVLCATAESSASP